MRPSNIPQVLFMMAIGVFNAASAADSNDPIVGQWKFVKATKVFHANGHFTDPKGTSKGSRGGTWKCVNPSAEPRQYEIVWANTKLTDILLLQNDGTHLSGTKKNAHGEMASAERLTSEDPDKPAVAPVADEGPSSNTLSEATIPPPSKRIEPFLEPSLNAVLAPLGENPQMPRIPVETLRASLGAGIVTAKTPAQKQIYQCAIAVCDALTNAMDERAQARAAAVASGLLPSISTGGGIVKSMPLHGWDAGHAGEAIRKKEKDERAYADKQAKQVSNFTDSVAYKAWVAKTTILRNNAMDLYTKLVQFEAADSLAGGGQ
jgi:hypothetical protein